MRCSRKGYSGIPVLKSGSALAALALVLSMTGGCMILPTEGETLVLDVYETKMNVQDLMAMTRESHQIMTKTQETLAQQEELRFNQLRDRIGDIDARLQRLEERLRAMESRVLQSSTTSGGGTAMATQPQPASAAVAPPPGLTISAADLYASAVGMFEKEQYNDAILIFNQIVEKHPQSEYAEGAQYGLAEAYEYLGDYAKSAEAYLVIPAKYPNGEKVAQARYKAAMCYVQLDDKVRARDLLQEILIKHPSIQGHPRVREALDALARQP